MPSNVSRQLVEQLLDDHQVPAVLGELSCSELEVAGYNPDADIDPRSVELRCRKVSAAAGFRMALAASSETTGDVLRRYLRA